MSFPADVCHAERCDVCLLQFFLIGNHCCVPQQRQRSAHIPGLRPPRPFVGHQCFRQIVRQLKARLQGVDFIPAMSSWLSHSPRGSTRTLAGLLERLPRWTSLCSSARLCIRGCDKTHKTLLPCTAPFDVQFPRVEAIPTFHCRTAKRTPAQHSRRTLCIVSWWPMPARPCVYSPHVA